MGGNGQHTNFRETSLGRAWIQKDEIAYYEANDSSRDAILTLRPAQFYGDHLNILAQIGEKGCIQCEILDAQNRSYLLKNDNKTAISSKMLATESGWNTLRLENNCLSSLYDRPLSLRLTLRNAKIYAIEGDLFIVRKD